VAGAAQQELKALVLIGGGMPKAYWYRAGEITASDLRPGTLVEVPLQKRKVPGIVVETGHPDLGFDTKPIHRVAPDSARLSAEWLELLRWISQYYLTPLPLVLQAGLPKAATRFLFHPPKRATKQPMEKSIMPVGKNLDPTAGQSIAIETISKSLESGSHGAFLLHGITGSGKTLVYLHLAKKALALGKRVLVLLPEIALTPQTIGRFESFLGRKVPAFHSGLSEPERRDLWKKIFAGEADIVVGARSAALAPLENLGLIVVDEEHDSSYKQNDPAPRYHARDVSLFRGKQAGCPVVLGSATPSLESYHAALTGKFTLLELKERATSSPLPEVEIVDMKAQQEMQGYQHLSIPLRDAVQQALDRGEQAILFLNRRGYSTRRVCRACGETRMCPHCAVALVHHRSTRTLRCHYCDFSISADSPCVKCGEHEMLDTGRGVEKVEEHLHKIFPGVGVARLDRDSVSRAGEMERILEEFKAGETRILLGTQMVAKGHDFPKVNVVGVLDADAGFGLADFRAGERAFQLITQVAGRAGRHKGSGRVFLQTYNPDSALLQHALKHDHAGFFRDEIERRREHGYPPFRRLLLFEMLSRKEEEVVKAMEVFALILNELAPQAHADVLGPAYAALKKIRNEHRLHVLVKGDYPNQLQWLADEAVKRFAPSQPKSVKLRMDRDPVSLL
jgi:primosomal protein N' (replication factor Y)